MTRGLASWLILLLIGLLVANLQLFSVRLDTTPTRMHTLADASVDLARGLEDTVRITYAVSDRLRNRFSQPEEIADLLRSYASVSRGKVVVELVDPVESGRAQEFENQGLVSQQLEVVDAGEQTLALVYSGIIIEYLDRREVLPFVFGVDTLEYEVTSALMTLVEDGRSQVAVIDPTTESNPFEARSLFASRLSTGYEVRAAAAGEPVPDDVAAAVVIGGQDLGQTDVAALRSYLDRGGSVLLAVDAVDVSIPQGLAADTVDALPLRDLIGRYGIELGAELILDESAGRVPVEEVSGGFRVTRLYDYPHWPVVDRRYTDAESPVTSRFPGLTLFWPSAITVSSESEAPARIIAATTPNAWAMSEPFVTNPQDLAGMVRDRPATTGQYGLVAVSADSDLAGRVAVVGDGDFLDDELIRASGANGNVEFAMSLVQWLAADDALLDIRTRAVADARLDPEGGALSPGAVTVLNVAVVPAAIVVAGLVRVRRRNGRGGRKTT